MKYLDEFRKRDSVEAVSKKIADSVEQTRTYRFMEVCGTHTMAISKYGLRSKLPANIKLISGPGCPVCVTEDTYIDKAISLSREKDVIITTFGDMLKVPGRESSLEKERASGGDIRVVYSTMDALDVAIKNPAKKVIFLGVGFETTTPTIASSILEAKKKNLKNYFVLCGHKTMPQALRALADGNDAGINGLILPAHVSTIIGAEPYRFLAEEFYIPCVIAGFEPLDIMQGIYMLIKQISQNRANVEIQYSRVAKPGGNPKARDILNKVFEESDVCWRGIGVIKASGLKIKKGFSRFDAEKVFGIKIKKSRQKQKGCMCGQILKGIKSPPDCGLFRNACSPENPVGPCMVSSEGTCAAYFRYER